MSDKHLSESERFPTMSAEEQAEFLREYDAFNRFEDAKAYQRENERLTRELLAALEGLIPDSDQEHKDGPVGRRILILSKALIAQESPVRLVKMSKQLVDCVRQGLADVDLSLEPSPKSAA